jgi:hypothetical protein
MTPQGTELKAQPYPGRELLRKLIMEILEELGLVVRGSEGLNSAAGYLARDIANLLTADEDLMSRIKDVTGWSQ